ncbi:MAG TPA: cyanophycin synthetase [Pyrinomonadaceae bacterium]|jgi:cyanophycin synthetase
MKIEQIKTLSGANVYTHQPALVMRLNLENLTGKESTDFSDFNTNLLALIPELEEHTCGLGYRGGFVEKLSKGTYFGHIVEHVAIELSHLADCEIAVNHGKTRQAGRAPEIYNVVVEYKAERAMRFLLEKSVEIVEKLIAGESTENLQNLKTEILKEARNLVARYEFGPSTRSIVEAARRRNIPAQRIGEGSLVQLGYGKNLKRIQAASTSKTSAIATEIACDKELTKQILRQAEIPVPFGETVCTIEEAVRAFREIGAPVAVKPLDGRQGKGVSLNLLTEAEVRTAFEISSEFTDCVLIEEMFIGRDYRVLVVNGKMVAASERNPPFVVGDGKSNVAALVEKENQNPLRGEGHEKSLTKLKIDEIAVAHLAKKGLTLDFVPAAGEMVTLRGGCNLSTGGTAKDVTDTVHPSIRKMCQRAARIVGLDICGVDLVMQDISQPIKKGAGGIIELNAAPGLRMHLQPSEGKPLDVGEAIVEGLFPHNAESRIPIISITGTNGKTTVTRMILHVFSSAGKRVGMTATSGIYVGGDCIAEGDMTGPNSARTVLNDPAVEVAVLETARGGIVKRGLGYDWSDVAIITNIQADHIGQDGIESVEDILDIKSLVAERVKKGGTLVLNADDQLLARFADDARVNKVPKQIVYFSLKPNHVLLRRHVSSGGTAYTVKNGWIVELSPEGEFHLGHVSEIPATFNGQADFNVANVLASIAACRAQNVPSQQIMAALGEFRTVRDNEGRFNLFHVNDGYVLIDYAHNPEAVKAVCRMAAKWHDGERRVTGIVTAPGNRDDELIAELGRVAARGFHRVIVREDADLRGRRTGEVAEILYNAVKAEAPEIDCRIVLDESDALKRQISVMREGDIIVCFYENFEAMREILAKWDAQPASGVEKTVARFSLARA